MIVDYDINDYKAKTELTADKLFTAMTAALRSHQQLQRMVETRRGLEIIIEAASTLFDFKSMQRLAEGVLTQIASLLNAQCAGILVLREAQNSHETFSVLAGSGCYSRFIGTDVSKMLENELRKLVEEAFARRQHEFSARRSVLYIKTLSEREVVVVLEAARNLSDTDRALVEIFCSRLSIAFDNVILYEQLQAANARLEERVAQRTQDLTAANRRLAAQWARLRQANTFKSEILGTVAHDLKNPLGVILGRTEILKEMIGGRRRARRQHGGADRLHPQRRQPADRDGRRSRVRRHGRRARHHDPARGGRSRRPGAGSRGRKPAARGAQAAEHRGVGTGRSDGDVRFRPHPRGDRQSGEQRHQVQPDRRDDRPLGGARPRMV